MNSFKIADLQNVSLEVNQQCPLDLYVFLASTGQYLQLVTRGEILTPQKLENIEKLRGKNLYQKNEAEGTPPPNRAQKNPLREIPPEEIFQKDLLGPKTEAALKSLYENIFKNPTNLKPQEISQNLIKISEEVLSAILPEVNDQREMLLKNLRNLSYMTHATAICSLAVLTAIANDFKSKTSLETLTQAALLMDSSLAEIEETYIETYYRNRSELPGHVWEKIRSHPLKSQQAIAYLPTTRELTNQIILGHHELHNGKGFHRGVKLGALPAIVAVMAFAVDLYEQIKSAELNESEIDLHQAIQKINERHLEPHLRRHSEKTVKNVLNYLNLKS